MKSLFSLYKNTMLTFTETDTENILPFVLLNSEGKIITLPLEERVSLDQVYLLEGFHGDISQGVSIMNMSLKDLNNWLTNKMGLDLRKFGYIKPIRQELKKKIRRVPKGELNQTIRALNTIYYLMQLVDAEGQEELYTAMLPLLADYSPIKGSRDQTPFQLSRHTVQVILDGMPIILSDSLKQKIIELLLGAEGEEGLLHEHKKHIKTGKYAGATRYYTFSEEQLKHIKHTLNDAVLSLLKLKDAFSFDHKKKVLQKLWDFRSTHEYEDERNGFLKATYLGDTLDAETYKNVLENLRAEEARETDIVRSMVLNDLFDVVTVDHTKLDDKMWDFLIDELKEDVLEYDMTKNFITILLKILEDGLVSKHIQKQIITVFLLLQQFNDEDGYKKLNFQPVLKLVFDLPDLQGHVFEILLTNANLLEPFLEEIELHTMQQKDATYDSWTELKALFGAYVLNKIFNEDFLQDNEHEKVLTAAFHYALFSQQENETVVDFLLSHITQEQDHKWGFPEFIKNRITKKIDEKQEDILWIKLLTKIFQYCNEPTKRYIQFQFMVRNLSGLEINANQRD